jgi:hypothetical protein
MKVMDLTTMGGLVARHALTTFGGYLAAHGYLASGGTNEFVGAGMVVIGVAWSWWQKQGQAAIEAELARVTATQSRRSTQSVAQK